MGVLKPGFKVSEFQGFKVDRVTVSLFNLETLKP
jgi:hypothetical protein